MRIQDIVKLGHSDQVELFEEVVRVDVGAFLHCHEEHPLPTHHPSYVSLSEAFWLWRLASDLEPWLTVESGSFHGYSAWWLRRGWTAGRMVTFDPERSLHEDVAPKMGPLWEHCFEDFSALGVVGSDPKLDWGSAGGLHSVSGGIVTHGGLAFFDDHVDQRQRLHQAVGKGFRHACFHDCYANTGATRPESLWSRGVGLTAHVVQFPVVRSPAIFREPVRSMHSWLTYVSVA